MRVGVKKSGLGRHIGVKVHRISQSIGDKDTFMTSTGLMAPSQKSSMAIENNSSNISMGAYVPNIKKSFILEKRRRF
jgi:hypothetical protein